MGAENQLVQNLLGRRYVEYSQTASYTLKRKGKKRENQNFGC